MPRLRFKNFLDTIVSFIRTDATSARVYQFQDRSGTIADDTDIAGRVPTTRTVNGHELSANVTVTKGDVGLGNVDNTSDATKNSATATLTNKRITPRVQSVASSATVTPNSDSDDMVKITAQAAGLTLANPSGTPVEGQVIVIRIKDDGTARSIAFGTEYRAIGVTAPTTTVISKTMYICIVFNITDTKWDIVSVLNQA